MPREPAPLPFEVWLSPGWCCDEGQACLVVALQSGSQVVGKGEVKALGQVHPHEKLPEGKRARSEV